MDRLGVVVRTVVVSALVVGLVPTAMAQEQEQESILDRAKAVEVETCGADGGGR